MRAKAPLHRGIVQGTRQTTYMIFVGMGIHNIFYGSNAVVFQIGIDEGRISSIATIYQHILPVTFHQNSICLPHINKMYRQLAIQLWTHPHPQGKHQTEQETTEL